MYFNEIRKIVIKWNKNRLLKRKIRKTNQEISQISGEYAAQQVGGLDFPDVKKLVIVDPLGCYGDALYVLGLLRRLTEYGFVVGVITNKHLQPLYVKVLPQDKIYIFEDDGSVNSCLEQEWDMAVDLCYMWNHHWEQRRKIIPRLRCYKVVCDPCFMENKAGIYSAVIDWRQEPHFGDRMSRVVDCVRKKVGEPRIFPFYLPDVVEGSPTKRYIYINTVGRVVWRSFSDHQVKMLIDWAKTLIDIDVFFYIDNSIKLEESGNIKIARTKSFIDACNLVSGAAAVVTPDTSIVHVASAMDIPILAFYCRNDPEVFGKMMYQIWAPLSTNSRIVLPEEDEEKCSRISIRSASDRQMIEGLAWLENHLNAGLVAG